MSEFDFARYFLLGRPHDMVLITQVPLISEQEIAETLARMKATDPDSYALLTEHLDIPEHLLPL